MALKTDELEIQNQSLLPAARGSQILQNRTSHASSPTQGVEIDEICAEPNPEIRTQLPAKGSSRVEKTHAGKASEVMTDLGALRRAETLNPYFRLFRSTKKGPTTLVSTTIALPFNSRNAPDEHDDDVYQLEEKVFSSKWVWLWLISWLVLLLVGLLVGAVYGLAL